LSRIPINGRPFRFLLKVFTLGIILLAVHAAIVLSCSGHKVQIGHSVTWGEHKS